MRAITVEPRAPDSLRITELPRPRPAPGELLVRGLAVGVCGTDREIVSGRYGRSPPGRDRLVLGHESLGRVETAPEGSGFAHGDLVARVVRRPDPEPCGACAHGEWDMCRNGEYTERGITGLDGYAAQWWTVPVEYAVAVDRRLGRAGVLTEPTSVAAKAWEQIERIGARAWFRPRRVLITGAGPIGLLAALLGVQKGLEVHVLDRVADGPKPALVRALGAEYHADGIAHVTEHARPDVVIEATGVGALVLEAAARTGPYGIVCLTGVSSGGRTLDVDAGLLNREIVLENDVIVGSVNANLRHYRLAAEALSRAPVDWLRGLVTTRIPLADAACAFAPPTPHYVKVVIDLDEH